MRKLFAGMPLIFVLLGLLQILFSTSQARSIPDDPLPAIYKSLPDEEKSSFLLYYLAVGLIDPGGESKRITLKQDNQEFVVPDALGIDSDLIDKFQNMAIPAESSKTLIDWTANEFQLTNEDMKEVVVHRSVDVGGRVIGIGDIGGLCCPW